MIKAIETKLARNWSLDTDVMTSIYFRNCYPSTEMYYMEVYRTDAIRNIKAQFCAFKNDEIDPSDLAFFYGFDHVNEGTGIDWSAEMDDDNNIDDYANGRQSGHTIFFCER